MSDVAALLAQLTARTEPAADPALAAVRLVRASMDALVLKLGQSIDARVTAQLAAGLTQLTAGSDSFVLKLETPIPVGTPVTVKVTPTPTGQPAVSVTPQSPPQPAAPLAVSTSPTHLPVPTQPVAVAARPIPTSAVPASPQPAAASPAPSPPPTSAAQAPLPPAIPASTTLAAPIAQPPTQPVQPAQPQPTQTAATPPRPSQGPAPTITATAPQMPTTAPALLSTPTPTPAVPPATVPQPTSAPALAANAPAAPPPPAPTILVAAATYPSAPPAPTPPATAPLPTTPASPATTPPPGPIAPQAVVQAPQQPAPPPATPVATAPAAPTLPRPAALPLQQVLADPVQSAARQVSVAPLLAQAATVLAAPVAARLPMPVLAALAGVLASRVDLNRAPLDGKALRQAVLQAGTLETGPRQPADMRSTLLTLRSALTAFLGGKVDAVAPVAHRSPPPMAGEPPRAPLPAQPAPPADLPAEETARQLLGQTDGALARTRLLQLASTPPEIRTPAPAATPELRFEIPMLLGAETGILQLLVERDTRHKHTPRERGWRMRFAMSFSATGEVGADIALLGRAANVSIWAAEPATADALEAMLPELAPALASHGLDVAGLRVKRGAPSRRPQAPGRLLDSAR